MKMFRIISGKLPLFTCPSQRIQFGYYCCLLLQVVPRG
jgi:hypothetical protein